MYSYKNEQQKLDVIKWNESMKTGEDKCGSYSYCSLCKKDEEYPCAKAKRRESQGARCRSESVTEKNRSGGEK